MVTPSHGFPALDPRIEVQDDLVLPELWERFEVFEALHHRLTICNPLSTTQFDEVVDGLAPRDGQTMLDLACGYGELLVRARDRADVAAVGIDLSPWMIATAHDRTVRQGHRNDIRLMVADARHFAPESPADLAACIGAEWIWHDVGGTARAIRAMVRPGARVAIGGARLHFDADARDVARRLGRIETVDDQLVLLETSRLRAIARIDATDDGWDTYLLSTRNAARHWAITHPGPRAEQWLVDQADWHDARERDRGVIGWSVWIAEAH